MVRRRPGPRRPWRSTGRNTGPVEGAVRAVHARAAVTGQVGGRAVDLDEVAAWLGGDEPVDPFLLLHAWNLFWDVASGTGRSFAHRSPDLDHIYNKLFAANNLPP